VGAPADDFGHRRSCRFDADWVGHAIFLTGLVAVLAVFAVLDDCLLLPIRPIASRPVSWYS
jgi:hypothetical protein